MYFLFSMTLFLISTQIFAVSGELCLNQYRDMLTDHDYYKPGSETIEALSDIKDCFKNDHSSFIDLGLIIAPWMLAAAPVRVAVGAAKSALLPVDYTRTQIRQTKYTNMYHLMLALQEISQRARELNSNSDFTKDNFFPRIEAISLENDSHYQLFISSEVFQNFRRERPETDRILVNALLYNYLFGALMCGETHEFSPITLKKFTKAFHSTQLI